MKKTTMLLLAFLCTGYALLAQPASIKNRITKQKTNAAKTDPGLRLLCDPNFWWTGSTATPGTYIFEIENPVPGYYYDWDFGDSTTGADAYVTHTFPGPGSYTVTLQSHNPQFNDTCRESITLCVGNAANCWANYTWTSCTSGPGIYYFSVADPQDGISYSWNFGDGKTATGEWIEHIYYATGSYDICLTAVNEETSESCTQCTNICVNQVPACWANFTTQPTGVVHEFHFTAETSSDLEVASYYWDFGDGNNSTRGPETNYQYSEPGQFTACLTIVYANDCVGTYCMDVVVRDPSTIDDMGKQAAPRANSETSRGAVINEPANDDNVKKTIRAIPNPVNGGALTLNINAANSGTYRYNIYNAQGEPVITGTKNLVKGIQNIMLDVHKLQPGRYWIELISSKQQLRTGFIRL